MTILEKPAAQQPQELVAVVEKHGLAGDGKSLGRILGDAGFRLETNPVAAVVDAAHQAGGVCLIAHPGRRDGFVCYDVDLLDQLRQEVPIDGLEVHYPAHSPEQVSMVREYARKHRLLTSSGSDSYSPDKPPIKYPVELSRNLLERLGIQVK